MDKQSTIDWRVVAVLIGGLINVSVSAPASLPMTLSSFIDLLNGMQHLLFAHASQLTVPVTAERRIFYNGFGIVDVAIGALLLAAVRNVNRWLAVIAVDGLARLLFAGVLLYYWSVFDAPPVAAIFAVVEIILGTIYCAMWLRGWQTEKL